MSITKKFLKTKPVCKVTFSLSGKIYESAGSIHVLGDFNAWQPGISPMKRSKTGEWSVQVDLAVGQAHQFRYLINETFWENDPEADHLVENEFGSENSALEL